MRWFALVLVGLVISLPAVGRETQLPAIVLTERRHAVTFGRLEPCEAQPPALALADRRGEAVPVRAGCSHIGGGAVDVRQPAPNLLVVALLGATAATGHPCGSEAVLDFEVAQGFEVLTNAPSERPRLSLEVETIGLLRGGRIAFAFANGGAAVTAGETAVVTATLPGRTVACGENLSVADRSAPDDVVVAPGLYVLRASWRLSASHPKGLRGKAASAEFAPEPALPPVWRYGPRDPFHGVGKKDFGFRVTVRIAPAPDGAAAVELR